MPARALGFNTSIGTYSLIQAALQRVESGPVQVGGRERRGKRGEGKEWRGNTWATLGQARSRAWSLTGTQGGRGKEGGEGGARRRVPDIASEVGSGGDDLEDSEEDPIFDTQAQQSEAR